MTDEPSEKLTVRYPDKTLQNLRDKISRIEMENAALKNTIEESRHRQVAMASMPGNSKPKVVELDPHAERREDVIERLEYMLERAEAGDMTGFAFAITGLGGSVTTGFTGTADRAKRIGSLQILIHRLCAEAVE